VKLGLDEDRAPVGLALPRLRRTLDWPLAIVIPAKAGIQ
jgi:hypothetical protein